MASGATVVCQAGTPTGASSTRPNASNLRTNSRTWRTFAVASRTVSGRSRKLRHDYAALDADARANVGEPPHDAARARRRQACRSSESGDADRSARIVLDEPVGRGRAPPRLRAGVDVGDVGRVDGRQQQTGADVAERVDQQLKAAQQVFGAEPAQDSGERGLVGGRLGRLWRCWQGLLPRHASSLSRSGPSPNLATKDCAQVQIGCPLTYGGGSKPVERLKVAQRPISAWKAASWRVA
jgi:hypothetical protein